MGERFLDYRDDLHAQAFAVIMRRLLDRATAAQRVAFDLGVDVAEVELGVPGLMDADAQAFVQEFEHTAIRSLAARESAKLRAILLHGVQQGKGVAELTRDLRGALEQDRWRVRSIARTETNRAANWGRYAGWRKSGLVQRKQFVATLDDRVRPSHLAADGEEVGLDEPFTRGAAAGLQAPPLEVNCRCTIAPVTRLTEQLPRSEAEVAREETRRELEERLGMARGALTAAFAAAAVRREIPGLRQVEEVHATQLLQVWDAWGTLLERALRGREVRARAA